MNKSRAILIVLAILVAGVAVGWFANRNSSTSSSSGSTGGMTVTETTTSQMDGMTMGDTTPGSMNGGSHSTGGSMGGATAGSMGGAGIAAMRPLVVGADGTKASAAGLTLEPQHTVLSAGHKTRWQIRVTDTAGMPVEKFERDQTKYMHLIVVRSDLTGYQHLHPTLAANGVFAIELTLAKPGSYRAIADFTTGSKRYALGVPIKVPGSTKAAPLPGASLSAKSDGYDVVVTHKSISAGSEARLIFTIARSGKPVMALLPYLGAYGHLVALRKPTLAYSHVHPTSQNRSRGMIGFSAEFPSSGAYRLFLQFRTSSGVHTAPFTIKVV